MVAPVAVMPVAETAESAVALAPIGKDLHPQVEVDRRADEVLDFRSGRAPDVTDPLPACSDQDTLLAVPLDVENRPNVYRRLPFSKLLDCARNAVGHFFVELFEGGLADELRDEEPDRCRADLVFGIEEGPLWQRDRQLDEEVVDPFSGQRGDEPRIGQERPELVPLDRPQRVQLVEYRDHWRTWRRTARSAPTT